MRTTRQEGRAVSIEVALFGVLGRDAESKISKNGKEYLRINVRCGDGDTAQWINAMTFDPEAIAAADRLVKGSRVYIEGTLRLDSWTGQDGAERHGLSVMSWHCKLAAIGRNRPKRESGDSEQRPESHSSSDRDTRVRGTADRDLDDEIPF
jgi:single stranded DNA-binding protein